ncbi:MAG: hypothetical protein MJZ33_01635 [Paludibacteraceae bacterium]|nr:hypothetical protein [Paludibacteraceae bacterium]
MTETKQFISNLPKDKKKAIEKFFFSLDEFYDTIYLIVQNGHILELNQPDMWEVRHKNIEYYRTKADALLDSFGLDGKELVADIASDYFEDFVHYRKALINISSEKFVEIIKKLQ